MAHVSYTAVGEAGISYIKVRMKWGRKSHLLLTHYLLVETKKMYTRLA